MCVYVGGYSMYVWFNMDHLLDSKHGTSADATYNSSCSINRGAEEGKDRKLGRIHFYSFHFITASLNGGRGFPCEGPVGKASLGNQT